MAMGEQRKGALQFNTFLLNDLTKRLNQQEMVEVDGVGGGGGGACQFIPSQCYLCMMG